MHILKIGGNELDNPNFLAGLAQFIAQAPTPLVIVHGGGRAIAHLQSQLGLTTTKVDGLRVTDGNALRIAQMVLSGHSNKQLVMALLAAGVDAVGLSGIDGGLLQCHPKPHPTADLGFVGQIHTVRTTLIHTLLQQAIIPIISPISLGPNHHAYNVNADEAATAVALALNATLLDFISNVPGVLQEGQLIPQLTPTTTETLIQKGVIYGGMIPKVKAALQAIHQGIPQTRIVNLAGLHTNSGTTFTAISANTIRA